MNVYFEPWIGENYKTSKKKILVLGDSHYCGGCDNSEECGVRGFSIEDMKECKKFTNNTITEYLTYQAGKINKAEWMKSYLQFDKIYYGKNEVTAEESIFLWKNIAFYNFLQTASSNKSSNTNYTSDDYHKSSPMATEVINSLLPDFVIVWGSRAWNSLTGNNWTNIDNLCGYYTLPDTGHIVHCIKITHPSRASIHQSHKILFDFMEKSQ